MNLQEWRAAHQPESITLPSGLEVKLRPVTLLDLVMEGKIPETLDVLVQKATGKGFTIAELGQMMPLIDAVVRAALVEPELADVADETHITLREIPPIDKYDIFVRCNSAADALRPFPDGQGGTVAAAQPGEGIQQPAQRSRRRRR